MSRDALCTDYVLSLSMHTVKVNSGTRWGDWLKVSQWHWWQWKGEALDALLGSKWLRQCVELVVQSLGVLSVGRVKGQMSACARSKTLFLSMLLTLVLLVLAQPSPPDLPGTSSWEGVWSEVHVKWMVDRVSSADVWSGGVCGGQFQGHPPQVEFSIPPQICTHKACRAVVSLTPRKTTCLQCKRLVVERV